MKDEVRANYCLLKHSRKMFSLDMSIARSSCFPILHGTRVCARNDSCYLSVLAVCEFSAYLFGSCCSSTFRNALRSTRSLGLLDMDCERSYTGSESNDPDFVLLIT